jgi:hypothetical protein
LKPNLYRVNLDGLRLRKDSLFHSELLLLGEAFKSDQDGSIGEITAHASCAQECSARMEDPEPLRGRDGFRVSLVRCKARKPLDLASVLNRKIKPAFVKLGIAGVGWHTFRHSVGSTLAEFGDIS